MTEVRETRSAPSRPMVRLAGLALAAATVPMSSQAEVASVGSSGFEVRELLHVAAPPAEVYAAVLSPARWWDSQHTYSGHAANLTLEAKAGGCWCETLPDGGSVLHMTVVYVVPGKTVRLRGELGPLQAMGVDGSMTVSMKSAGGGTDLKLTYVVGGYAKDGFESLSKAVDGVLGGQVARLKRLIETGAPDDTNH